MKLKKLMALTLSVVMAASVFTACGSGNGTASQSEGAGSGENGSGENKDASGAQSGETAHLELYAISFGGNNDSLANVNQAVNDYIKPLINADVKLNIISYGSYAQQVNLMMSGDAQVDLMLSTGSLTSNLAGQGALMPLDDMLANQGADIVSIMGEDVLASCKYGGVTYAVPTNRDLARSMCYYYRDDINQELGLGLENAKTLDDIEKCFEIMHEKDPEMSGIAGNNTASLLQYWSWDAISNNYGVLMDLGSELKVVNLYETDEYKELVERMHKWYESGYIYKEIATSTVSSPDLFATGKMLGYFANGNPTMDNSQSQMLGGPIKHIELVEPYMSSTTVQTACWTIPHNSKNPEKAMELLNLMYTDADLVNLLCYGIEGENYVIKDEEQGIIGYPEGQNAQTRTYDNTLGWTWGNMLIGYTWEGDDPDVHQQMTDFNNSAKRSKALGFTFDPTNVQNQITACSNVATKYTIGIESGSLDPAEALPKFQEELKSAGIDQIIAEKQRQLDEWAAGNGIE